LFGEDLEFNLYAAINTQFRAYPFYKAPEWVASQKSVKPCRWNTVHLNFHYFSADSLVPFMKNVGRDVIL
jgi:hypothetical protein